MNTTKIKQNEARYLSGLVDWALLTMQPAELEAHIHDPEKLADLMKAYNEAYNQFWQKVVNLYPDDRKKVSDIMCTKVYTGIRLNMLIKEHNQQINKILERD